MNSNKVLLIDPHQLSREGFTLLLADASYEVVGATRSLDEAHAAIELGLQPDLVLLVLAHPDEISHASTMQQVRTDFSEFKFVIVATEVSSAFIARCIEAGVDACLLRDMSAFALTQTLRVVMLGQQVFPTLPQGDEPTRGPRDFGLAAEPSGFVRALSGREGEILRHLLHGYSNKMIARELNINEATVKVHLKALLRKLKARNRTQAAIWAVANGYAPRKSGGTHSFADAAA
jgi:two-component system, NarL family, nitrate/nitrite response regulator NarL